jgi:hypothetical protein
MNFLPVRKSASTRKELFEVIEQVRKFRGLANLNGYRIHEMYRGQSRSEWKLLANLGRKLNSPAQAKEVERLMVNEFAEKLKAQGLDLHIRQKFLNGTYHSEWLMLQQAQHFGLPTRFMDWTIHWEVALYFSVSDTVHDDSDAQFWIYLVPGELFVSDSSQEKNQYLNEDPFESERMFFLNSSDFLDDDSENKIAQRRKFRQHGRFCIQPYDLLLEPLEEQTQHQHNLFLITIPAEAKPNIRRELEYEGLTKDALYVEHTPRINKIIQELRIQYGA